MDNPMSIGLPRAQASWPSSAFSESPQLRGGTLAGSILRTARSLASSRPTSFAGYPSPDEVSTFSSAARPSGAATWAFVTIEPSASMAKPEPAKRASSFTTTIPPWPSSSCPGMRRSCFTFARMRTTERVAWWMADWISSVVKVSGARTKPRVLRPALKAGNGEPSLVQKRLPALFWAPQTGQ
jgi:hypothetical protein